MTLQRQRPKNILAEVASSRVKSRRRNCHGRFLQRRCVLAGAFLLGILAAAAPAGAFDPADERYVTDRLTGLAISGYDPVAYFTRREAVPGISAYEWAYSGTIWRFQNEGNRFAFKDNPEIYAPKFGGYDVTEVAEGRAIPGNPRIFALHGEDLYLFRDERNRDRFLFDVAGILNAAKTRWSAVRRGLDD